MLTLPRCLKGQEPGTANSFPLSADSDALQRIRLGLPTIAARVMPADSNGLALTQLSIADNTSIRELNAVEQALAAAKLSGL
ncbi:MAG: hypothetical protein R2860_12650 [Desulfobacterales bacterium]